MRTLVRGAIEGARDALVQFTKDALQDRDLTQEEVVRRYVTEHRNQPDALIEFARQNAPQQANPITEAVRYEQEMERLLRARGG